MANLLLLAPLAGWCSPLEEAPDPVFAERMLGEGVVIDPTSATVVAPCDGEVILIPGSRHAVTLRALGGVEVLIHVGIDTVALGGEGFEQLAQVGAIVRAGEPLLSFDMDLVARRAKSLVTPVIVAEGRGLTVVRRSEGRSVAMGEVLMELARADAEPSVGAAAYDLRDAAPPVRAETVTCRIRVPFEHGIHARPAALLASAIKALSADVSIGAHGREVDARSTVALMSLGVHRGDEITVSASGRDAKTAVEAVVAAVVKGPSGAQSRAVTFRPVPQALGSLGVGPERVLRGVVANRGLAIGPVLRFGRQELSVAEEGAGIAFEQSELQRARTAVAATLSKALESASGTAREIVAAHLELVDDPQFVGSSSAWVAKGKSAGWAWRAAVRISVEALRDLHDPRMAERVDDLLDLETQVLLALRGAPPAGAGIPAGAILVATELLPSQLISLDASRVGAICMAAGGPTSHAAILAAAMGIPAVVALGPQLLEVRDGVTFVVDADAGLVHVDPERSVLEAAERRVTERRNRRAQQEAAAQSECRTADGARIEVFANAGSLTEAQAAVRHGAEGCGLLRTEFLFLERTEPPDEAEQAARYQEIASAFAGRPVVIRTLDAGGDKPIPYLPLAHEDNPALGLRGVRTSLWHPELLRTQLRAILRVQPAGQCRLLLPMITDAAEIRMVRAMLEEEQAGSNSTALRVGAMIETPAAALTAESISRHADFLSLGTNDLTQYTLAMDRGHPELAPRLDALHPAVLRLIATTTAAARARSRPVAVCGGLASDPLAVAVLIGLGVQELSVVPSVIPELKALIATLNIDDCRELARAALEQDSSEAVRRLLRARSDVIEMTQ